MYVLLTTIFPMGHTNPLLSSAKYSGVDRRPKATAVAVAFIPTATATAAEVLKAMFGRRSVC